MIAEIYFALGFFFAFSAIILFFSIKLKANSNKIAVLRTDFEAYYIQNSEFIDTKIEELKTNIEHLVSVVELGEKQRAIRYKLKNELESACENILFNHVNLNERFKHICIAGRKATLDFGEMILHTGIPITRENIETESGYHFDSLKSRCDSWFREVRQTIMFNETPDSFKTLSKYLKENTRIREYLGQLMFRLIDIKSGKYNGKTGEKIVSALVEFMQSVIIEGIAAFNTFQNLPEFIEIDGEMRRVK